MIEWYGCVRPVGVPVQIKPTAEIVQSACLDHVPGARLTSDLMGVMDSRGWVTKFYLFDGALLYACTWSPDGTSAWLRRSGFFGRA